jgi:ribosomal protein S18 acetylase RimI-like enzyme
VNGNASIPVWKFLTKDVRVRNPLAYRRLQECTVIPLAPPVFAVSLADQSAYSEELFLLPMDYVIRPLKLQDEPILLEILYHGLSSAAKHQPPPREMMSRPEISRYVEGWGRPGDSGFVAHDKNGMVLGAVWLRRPSDKSNTSPELALAVKPEHRRHGIGTALLTQLVRSNPGQSTIAISFVAGKPVLRLYERFGFKVVEELPDAVVMHRRA